MKAGRQNAAAWNELIRNLDPLLRAQHLKRGERLYSAGETPGGIYLLRRGRLRLVIDQGAPPQMLDAVALLGLSAAISGHPHSETAQAVEECELGFVSREALLEFLKDDAATALEVLRMLSEDVDVCYGRLRRLARPKGRRKKARS